MLKVLTAALIIENKKLLLVKNIKHGTIRVEPPGGKKEFNETLEECVIREVKEELGLEIDPIKLFGIYKTNSPEGDFNVNMYLARIIGGTIVLKEPKKIADYGWYSLADINNIKDIIVPNLANALPDLRLYL